MALHHTIEWQEMVWWSLIFCNAIKDYRSLPANNDYWKTRIWWQEIEFSISCNWKALVETNSTPQLKSSITVFMRSFGNKLKTDQPLWPIPTNHFTEIRQRLQDLEGLRACHTRMKSSGRPQDLAGPNERPCRRIVRTFRQHVLSFVNACRPLEIKWQINALRPAGSSHRL